jgi:hypothetical protein
MAKLFSTRRGLVVALIAAGVLLLLAVVMAIWIRWLLVPYLIALVVAAGLWFGLDWWMKARARKKQMAFDAAVAAKEGIDDRRREWASWTSELRKQGIDRHTLPFYLLLGEPQSGKSVLLQNSDLHFPFGQNRLSGVGGTRGCDWWFTEEAVILDLAGRLFTHEGGASDEAEWAAFLDLLSEFRPMCPANGVLLVLPCDGLLNDGPQQASTKASRMQNALITLTQRLQVQLPVYVVLTKGDKVFGFAESVHRLDTDKRHEMLGWSRPSEKVESPFSIDEAREGFGYLLARCRGLRASMLATARIPEALGEVDRLYVFPDELAQVQANLEIYLRKIFTESQLVERLFFRGIYLTSGLQTGTPIVKACAALLGQATDAAGEADGRALESLFSKQRAYFIKDLVRKRLFEERGVVRPTKSRVSGARRNAIAGYGAGGLITVLMIAGVATYSASASSDTKTLEDVASGVRRRVEGATGTSELPGVLDLLERLKAAATAEPPLLERMMPFGLGSSRGDFQETYLALFDSRMPATLRNHLEAKLLEQMKKESPTYDEFFDQMGATTLLQRDLLTEETTDPGRDDMATLARIAGKDGVVTGADGKPFGIEDAVHFHREFGDPGKWPPSGPASAGQGGRSPALQAIEEIALKRMDGVLDFNQSWHVVGEPGRFVAWVESRRILAAIRNDPTSRTLDAHRNAALYLDLVRMVLNGADPAKRNVGDLAPTIDPSFKPELADLAARRADLLEGAGKPKEEWIASRLVNTEFKGLFGVDVGSARSAKKLLGSFARAAAASSETKPLPLEHEKVSTQTELNEFLVACRAEHLPDDLVDLAAIPAQIKAASTRWLGEGMRENNAGKTALAKIHAVRYAWLDRHPARDAAEAAASAEKLEGELSKSAEAMPAVVHLVGLKESLLALKGLSFGDWIPAQNRILEEELKRVGKAIPDVVKRNPYVDAPTLVALRGTDSGAPDNAAQLKTLAGTARRTWLDQALQAIEALWDGPALEEQAEAAKHLPKLLDALVAASEESTGAGSGDAIAPLKAAVVKRLRALRNATLRNWEVNPAAFRTVVGSEAVATEITKLAEASAFNDRRERIVSGSPLLPALDALRLAKAPDTAFAKAFHEIHVEVADLASALEPKPAAEVARSSDVATLLAFAKSVDGLYEKERANRHTFAKAWAAIDDKYLASTDSYDSGQVGARFVASVVVALDKEFKPKIRTWFVDEFGEKFLRPTTQILWRNAVLHGEGSLPTGEALDALGDWIDRRSAGGIDEIRDDFALHLDKRGLRPTGADRTAEPQEARLAWDAWDFLNGLQTFLFQGEKKKVVDAAFDCTLELDVSDPGNEWGQLPPKGAGFLAFVLSAQRGGRPTVGPLGIGASLSRRATERAGPIAWTCSDSECQLRWSTGARGDVDAERPGVVQKFEGPLGLLVLAWKHGRPVVDASADPNAPSMKWRVEVPIEDLAKTKRRYPFTLDFKVALPPMPESLREHDERK